MLFLQFCKLHTILYVINKEGIVKTKEVNIPLYSINCMF